MPDIHSLEHNFKRKRRLSKTRICIVLILVISKVLQCRFALSKLHPLLGYAASLEGSDQIKCFLIPTEMHLPSEMMSLRLEPLKVSPESRPSYVVRKKLGSCHS